MAVSHFSVLPPTLKKLCQILIIVFRRTHIIILIRISGCHIRLRHGNIFLGNYLPCLVISDHLCPRRCLDGHFRLAVAVKIIYDKLCIMSTRTDIDPHIQTPQKSSIQFIAIYVTISRISFVGYVMRIGRIPFYKVFKLTVPVYITDTHIVCRILVGLPGRCHASLRLLQRNLQIIGSALPCFHRLAELRFHAVSACRHSVTILRTA